MTVPEQCRRLAGIIASMLIALVASACDVPDRPFDKSAGRYIKRIVLLESPEPKTYGAIAPEAPALIVGAHLASRGYAAEMTTRFDAEMKRRDLKIGAIFNQALEQALHARGYDVVRLTLDRPSVLAPNHLFEDYSVIETDADAILDVALVLAGYGARVFETYKPYLYAYVRMVDATKQSILYEDKIFYGWSAPYGRLQEAPRKYWFRNLEAVIDSPELAAEGLEDGVYRLAEQIVAYLR